jgi:hypothetical protein
VCCLAIWVGGAGFERRWDVQATDRFGAGSVYLVRFGRGLPGRLGASWWRSGLWDAPGHARDSGFVHFKLWSVRRGLGSPEVTSMYMYVCIVCIVHVCTEHNDGRGPCCAVVCSL